MKGTHPVVDQVWQAAERELVQHFGQLLVDWGVSALAAKLGHLSTEVLQSLLDHDTLAAQEDQVFGFLREWAAQAGKPPDAQALSAWAACRFAQVSPRCLLDAAKLEGADGGLPPRVVLLSLTLRQILEANGEAECDKVCKTLACLAPDGWLQRRRLNRRKFLENSGELRLFIYRSSQPTFVTEISEQKTTTIIELKSRLCAELGLAPDEVHIWNNWKRMKHEKLEHTRSAATLQDCGICDGNPIMLDERLDDGTWSWDPPDRRMQCTAMTLCIAPAGRPAVGT